MSLTLTLSFFSEHWRYEGKGGGRGSHARSLVVKEDRTQRGRVLVSLLCLQSYVARLFAQGLGSVKHSAEIRGGEQFQLFLDDSDASEIANYCVQHKCEATVFVETIGGGENEFPNMVENDGNDAEEERDLALDDGFDLLDLAPPVNTEQTLYSNETTFVRPTPHNERNKLPIRKCGKKGSGPSEIGGTSAEGGAYDIRSEFVDVEGAQNQEHGWWI
ncbi:diguanylate cyclase [Sesbania bispinosa]|nr:diguanylate cyclase [Sesbania bispinosa]